MVSRGLEALGGYAHRGKRTSQSPQSPSIRPLNLHNAIPRSLDNFNNSCAYDAVITIVYNLWVESREKWTATFDALNADYLGELAANFGRLDGMLGGLVESRRLLQQHLQRNSPCEFRFSAETSIYALLLKLLMTQSVIYSSTLWCVTGHRSCRVGSSSTSCLLHVVSDHHSLQDVMNRNEAEVSSLCRDCGAQHLNKTNLHFLPPLLAFDVVDRPLSGCFLKWWGSRQIHFEGCYVLWSSPLYLQICFST